MRNDRESRRGSRPGFGVRRAIAMLVFALVLFSAANAMAAEWVASGVVNGNAPGSWAVGSQGYVPVGFTVRTSGYWTNVRSGPGTGYSVVRTLAPGTTVQCYGWQHGSNVFDLWYGTADYRWYRIDSPVSPPVVRTDPRVERAISWANGQCAGNRYYWYWTNGYCLKFVDDAYANAGWAHTRFAWATLAGDRWIVSSSTNPPRGAVVFYNWYGRIGGVYRNWDTRASRSATGKLSKPSSAAAPSSSRWVRSVATAGGAGRSSLRWPSHRTRMTACPIRGQAVLRAVR